MLQLSVVGFVCFPLDACRVKIEVMLESWLTLYVCLMNLT